MESVVGGGDGGRRVYVPEEVTCDESSETVSDDGEACYGTKTVGLDGRNVCLYLGRG